MHWRRIGPRPYPAWLRTAVLLAAGFAGGVFWTTAQNPIRPQPRPPSGDTAATVVRAAPSPTTASAEPPGAILGAALAPPAAARVTRVIDGDTVALDDGRHVRYIGMDAPEVSRGECFAAEAKAANIRLVLGQPVRLERDVTDTDRYDRLLRYVYVGDTMVNRQLVADGFATALAYPPDVRHLDQIRAAMAEAKAARRGLWADCLTAASREPPAIVNFDDRQNLRYDATKSVEPGHDCPIKGNVNARGEKIYHLPGCGSYEKTVIEENRGERWFCSQTEALAAGWRKAGNCR